jgi:hypothetical protein
MEGNFDASNGERSDLMPVIAILLLVSAISFGITFGIFWFQSKYRNGMMLAVKLPKEAEKDRAVRRIRERYQKEIRTLALIVVVAFLPVFLPWMAFQFIYFLIWVLVCSFAFIIPFRRANRELIALKKKNGWSVSPDGDDGDEYWRMGVAYHNPKDRRIFVEKRVGTGLTVNTGTLVGKLIVGGSLGLAAAAILWVIVLFVWSETSPPKFSFAESAEGERVEISYILYSTSFPVDEIRDVTLVDEIPRGSKTSGESTNRALRGIFRLEDIGKARLYVFKNNPPYIRIQLEDGYIFYNEEDPERTRQLYGQLLERLERGK